SACLQGFDRCAERARLETDGRNQPLAQRESGDPTRTLQFRRAIVRRRRSGRRTGGRGSEGWWRGEREGVKAEELLPFGCLRAHVARLAGSARRLERVSDLLGVAERPQALADEDQSDERVRLEAFEGQAHLALAVGESADQ